jgi:hypothetical protein
MPGVREGLHGAFRRTFMTNPPTPKCPRTPAQQIADYRKTFPRAVNERRLALIGKEFGPSDPERDGWRYDEHPGWREECGRRRHANLTDGERAELAECNRVLDEWLARSPVMRERRVMMDEMGERLEELKAKLAAKRAAGPAGEPPT